MSVASGSEEMSRNRARASTGSVVRVSRSECRGVMGESLCRGGPCIEAVERGHKSEGVS